MVLKSFGCSFIWGSELADEVPGKQASQLTWPALIAKQLGIDYQCYAWPGRGNLNIAERIMSCACPGDVVIVNWTYIDRFDYTHPASDLDWRTCRPSCSENTAGLYYRNFHSQFRDKLSSLIMISQCVNYLLQKRIRFVMSVQDSLLFETQWHVTPAILDMQQYIRPYMQDFDGQNFVDWARSFGHSVSDQGHLLESGHRAVAERVSETLTFQ